MAVPAVSAKASKTAVPLLPVKISNLEAILFIAPSPPPIVPDVEKPSLNA
jgi:hypothetical protein